MILQYFDVCMFDTLSDVLPLTYRFAADPEHQRKEIEGSSRALRGVYGAADSDNLVILYNVASFCFILFHLVLFCIIVFHLVYFCFIWCNVASVCLILLHCVALFVFL